MTRIKRGVMAHKRRKKVIKMAKGFKWGRKSKFKLAKDALKHAWTHAFNDRKKKKGSFRRLWQLKISAGVKPEKITYSRFINALKKSKIEIDRKILATLAENHPEVFKEIVKKSKGEK